MDEGKCETQPSNSDANVLENSIGDGDMNEPRATSMVYSQVSFAHNRTHIFVLLFCVWRVKICFPTVYYLQYIP